MKTFTQGVVIFSFLFISKMAFAFLPLSAISATNLQIYGLYTTSDPLCQTNLVPTLPITATPQTLNFASSPTLGAGSIASPINCIIIVMTNNVSAGWAAGTYTTTSYGNSDSVCNTAGTASFSPCQNHVSINWPPTASQLSKDMTTASLTMASTCTGTSSDIVALYISTDSACSGNGSSTTDPSACYANSAYPNLFEAPTAANDTSHGVLTTSPAASPRYKFVINPSNTFGGNGTACGSLTPPLFSFAVAQ